MFSRGVVFGKVSLYIINEICYCFKCLIRIWAEISKIELIFQPKILIHTIENVKSENVELLFKK